MAEPRKILTLNAISARGLARLPEAYTVGGDVTDPDGILVRSANMHEMDIPASVRAIARAGAGTNNIPVKKLSERGVPVFNAPGANANAVKELVIAGMLLGARNLVPALKFVEGLSGTDEEMHKATEAGKKQFAGMELPGRTLGVIGLGAIGSTIAEAAIKLGMNVVGFDPAITVDAAWRLPSQVRRAESVEDVLRMADFVTLHVPLLDATRNLVNAQRLGMMRSGAVLLNFAREGVVDNAAVIEALDAGKLHAYICDFPANALKGHARVVALPHLGASTEEAEENCAVMVAEQLADYLENGNILNSVNFPNVSMARESAYRIAIANANVPNMVGQISSVLAAAGLNIHNMVNKSKGDMAYTLVDIDSVVTAAVMQQLAAIAGVLAVRYLPA
ncbi:MAG: phosphoglycerate dehydrogenase [Thiobacillus sp.]|uniref:phosphoglycerate dehydrogenase n=1 Tax=unclassified Thiobacillus TaxID=2646513 RepID=UPI00086EE979|nr:MULTISPECIES: phosphoglycerate dehydrogenase [unclassified Thiobacillus]MBN8770819.1 phosphoglycerate dehydrogenase [Thiobacillus sp.]MBN8780517.1 phosphoglycerate dehydrogenase [Thiobacillus sp.]ODU99539.1 MAG: 3-phosphoglycerate dehydrogenase [Thiobacillus sp. SCN 63-57]OJY55529.1 MAG: 3-phosphoglycerate dehydrogenase [Thiobacillus sp. 0-1251]